MKFKILNCLKVYWSYFKTYGMVILLPFSVLLVILTNLVFGQLNASIFYSLYFFIIPILIPFFLPKISFWLRKERIKEIIRQDFDLGFSGDETLKFIYSLNEEQRMFFYDDDFNKLNNYAEKLINEI